MLDTCFRPHQVALKLASCYLIRKLPSDSPICRFQAAGPRSSCILSEGFHQLLATSPQPAPASVRDRDRYHGRRVRPKVVCSKSLLHSRQRREAVVILYVGCPLYPTPLIPHPHGSWHTHGGSMESNYCTHGRFPVYSATTQRASKSSRSAARAALSIRLHVPRPSASGRTASGAHPRP